jgi:hypothetical protein
MIRDTKLLIYTAFLLFLCLSVISCASSNAPESSDPEALIVDPKGNSGYDLFYTDDSYTNLKGTHSFHSGGNKFAFLYRAQLYSAPRDTVMLITRIVGLANSNSYTEELYLANTLGTSVRQIPGVNLHLYAVLAPDGNHVLYLDKSTLDLSIYDINAGTSTIVSTPSNLIADHAGFGYSRPVFSDDSKKILIDYVTQRSEDYLCLYDIPSQSISLIDYLRYTDNTTPHPQVYDWSPNGSQYCYFSYSSVNNVLKVRNVITNMIDSLFIDSSYPLAVKWSPDGTTIAFTFGARTTTKRVSYYLYDVAARQLTKKILPITEDQGQIADLEWTEDSKSLILEVEQGFLGITNIDNMDKTHLTHYFSFWKVNALTGNNEMVYSLPDPWRTNLFRRRKIGEH